MENENKKITLSVKNAIDIITRLKEIEAIPQELTSLQQNMIVDNICEIEL